MNDFSADRVILLLFRNEIREIVGDCRSRPSSVLLGIIDLAPVVQRVDNFILWISRYLADKMYWLGYIYPLDSDLSTG